MKELKNKFFLNLDKILVILIVILISGGVYLNVSEEMSVDQSKIPYELEKNSTFNKWLTNLKNKRFGVKENGEEMSADAFRKISESNIFNTIWTTSVSIDNDQARSEYEKNMVLLENFEKSAFSPNEREVVNYEFSERFGFKPNEVFFYGLREDRVLVTKVVDCDPESNCYFNRAGFLDNHVFFVSELSLKNYDSQEDFVCDPTLECEYSFKVHLIDLMNNQRIEYESPSFRGIFQTIKENL